MLALLIKRRMADALSKKDRREVTTQARRDVDKATKEVLAARKTESRLQALPRRPTSPSPARAG